MYDDKDLKTILARAVEIQNRTKGSDLISGSQEKLSLEDIEEIARESGLSPEYVRHAAVELEGVSIEEPFFLDTGNNHDTELLGFATGRLDQKAWAELRSIIEQEFGSFGRVNRRAGKIIWTAKPTGIFKSLRSGKTPSVEIKTSGYKSAIRIKKSLKSFNKLLYPGYAALVGSIMMFTLMLDTNDVSIFFAIAALLGISRLFFKWRDNLKAKSKEKLRDTMAQLQTIITRRYTASGDITDDHQNSIEFDERENQSVEKEMDHSARKKVH